MGDKARQTAQALTTYGIANQEDGILGICFADNPNPYLQPYIHTHIPVSLFIGDQKSSWGLARKVASVLEQAFFLVYEQSHAVKHTGFDFDGKCFLTCLTCSQA